MKGYDVSGWTPEPNGDFIVAALEFDRDGDSKTYIYLVPFVIFGDEFQLIRPQITSTSGPLDRACDMDTYAVELSFEFFRRNPLPYPAELYNYHYLFGGPSSTCLTSGPLSLRF